MRRDGKNHAHHDGNRERNHKAGSVHASRLTLRAASLPQTGITPGKQPVNKAPGNARRRHDLALAGKIGIGRTGIAGEIEAERIEPVGDRQRQQAASNAIDDHGAQREAFRKKFGRDLGPGDPIFFDPDADEPTPMSPVWMEAEVLAAMRKAGVSPAISYAYKKTGLMGFGDTSAWPADRLKEWDDAVKEYGLIEQASKQPDRPDPHEWNTQITELLVSPFTKQDLEQVRECLRAIAPIEARGMKVATRIELAAALLAAACEPSFEGREAIGEPDHGPKLFALTRYCSSASPRTLRRQVL